MSNRIGVDCATGAVSITRLTRAEEDELTARRLIYDDEMAVKAAAEAEAAVKAAEDRAAREQIAALDPRTATIEQIVTLLKPITRTRTVAVQAETERTST